MLSSDDLTFFIALARAPSFAAAARGLGVTPPAVTQRLRGLEARLGVRLFQRGARGVSLSDEGVLLAERASGVLADLDALSDLLGERRGQVRGHLRIAAPAGFGRRYVAPAVATFLEAHPHVTVSLELSDNPARLRPDAWDVIVHVGQVPSLDLQLRTLAPNARILCAAPAYLARCAPPETPAGLAAHRCLALFENDEDVTLWRFAADDGRTQTLRIDSPLRSNDGEVIRRWALGGLGVMLRSEWDVAERLDRGDLVRLLPEWSAPDAPVVALLGPRAGRAARTQRFVDTLREVLTPAPWRSFRAAEE